MIVESWGGEYEMRRSGQRDRCCSKGVHAKQAATVTGGRFAVAIRIPALGTAIMMAVACAVGVHVDAAVIVGRDDAMLVGQAVGGGRTIDEGERDRRRQNAQCIKTGERERRFDAISFGQSSQHRASRLNPVAAPATSRQHSSNTRVRWQKLGRQPRSGT
jgi:Tfp pilus assembly protein FimT